MLKIEICDAGALNKCLKFSLIFILHKFILYIKYSISLTYFKEPDFAIDLK